MNMTSITNVTSPSSPSGTQAVPDSADLKPEQALDTPDGLFKYLEPYVMQSGPKAVHMLCLDNDNRLLHHAWFPQPDDCIAVYRYVVALAFVVKEMAKLVLAQSHTRKSAIPDVAQRKLRADIIRALRSLDVEFQDHVIFSVTSRWSLRAGRTYPIGQVHLRK
jgi:DNA repair protein RadC